MQYLSPIPPLLSENRREIIIEAINIRKEYATGAVNVTAAPTTRYHQVTVIGLMAANVPWRVLVSLDTVQEIASPPYIAFLSTYLFRLPELASAIRKAAAGEAVMHSHVAARIAQELASLPVSDWEHYAQLSERERDVLRPIAEDLPNGDIARRLVISEKTVKSHVSNILSKLHLLDRTQAAVFAWREGFVSRFSGQDECNVPS
ncbi:response regulator transcription factor [Ktedonospora formicarum]|uniref:HTH luxR-type domain-containing protein n=1 Tax=Ktedonospora formicarum TaxID=2778364 RepID=A0A8J3I9E5_9CHLR|nr:response regulator transcription factor [Ktedonospora formicarum]GHO47079.1 hypothetical protein KSX_52420 [Ktedonospora formicarum]